MYSFVFFWHSLTHSLFVYIQWPIYKNDHIPNLRFYSLYFFPEDWWPCDALLWCKCHHLRRNLQRFFTPEKWSSYYYCTVYPVGLRDIWNYYIDCGQRYRDRDSSRVSRVAWNKDSTTKTTFSQWRNELSEPETLHCNTPLSSTGNISTFIKYSCVVHK